MSTFKNTKIELKLMQNEILKSPDSRNIQVLRLNERRAETRISNASDWSTRNHLGSQMKSILPHQESSSMRQRVEKIKNKRRKIKQQVKQTYIDANNFRYGFILKKKMNIFRSLNSSK